VGIPLAQISDPFALQVHPVIEVGTQADLPTLSVYVVAVHLPLPSTREDQPTGTVTDRAVECPGNRLKPSNLGTLASLMPVALPNALMARYPNCDNVRHAAGDLGNVLSCGRPVV
jgi:hypothetical protein